MEKKIGRVEQSEEYCAREICVRNKQSHVIFSGLEMNFKLQTFFYSLLYQHYLGKVFYFFPFVRF
jgi:hypothetical protein